MINNYQFKLEIADNGFNIILFLKEDSEFARELDPNNPNQSDSHFDHLYQSIKDRYPKLLINSVKLMVGGVLLATMPFATLKAKANTSQTTPTQQQNINQTYTVKSGDSLWAIANQYHITVNQLKQANNLISDTLSVNQQLIIPTSINQTTFQTTNSYTVKSGDSLWTIAKANNTSVDQLRQANNLRTDTLTIGQQLVIPKTITTAPITQTTTYIVQSGDSLWTIARAYNTSVDQLRQANNLRTDSLTIGQNLIIPQTTTTAPITQTTSYIVKSGDNLSVIASRYGITTNQLRTTNNLTTDVLQIGQVLQIPQIINTLPEQTPTATSYTVESGDNLSVIAARYGITTNQLRTTNNLTTDVLQIGQVLLIPQTGITQPDVTPAITSYTVKSGDSLSVIAARFGVTTNQLRITNNLTTDVLQIGQVLQIPQTNIATPSSVSYTVKSGDSLWTVANRYGVTVNQLRSINNLRTDTLTIGQVLQVPQGNDQYIAPAIGVKDVLYQVKSGDTLESIASTYNMTASRIREANNLASTQLVPNQALIIPLAYDAHNRQAPTTQYINYTVQSGDNLWSIAKAHATTAENIRSASNLRSDSLDIGQQITIPTTIVAHDTNSLDYLVEVQYNISPTSVFHDVTVRNQEQWSKATREQIYYYANPDNFVNDQIGKYQFLVLNYHEGMTDTHINTLLTNRGVFSGKGAAFNQAAKAYDVSQVYLVSHALLETGNGTTQLARGTLVSSVDGRAVTPRVVYNMYGINALDQNPNQHGAEYAYKQGWFTVEDAIIGGAKWISDNYINHPTYQQNTLYKMRYNPSAPGIHQYSTDVAWAHHQTYNINNLLAPLPNIQLEYDVPTFNNNLV